MVSDDQNLSGSSKLSKTKRSNSLGKSGECSLLKKKSKKTRKNKTTSVFDEYENRGDVLEGYEDLNSGSSEDDSVLSQIYQKHAEDRSRS